MKTLKQTLTILLWVFLFSCQVGPKPIEYGTDSCDYCRMTIVDKIHAAEIVTKKGKIYKFDAIECMVNFNAEFENSEIKMFLCNDYNSAETLIDAKHATFLISQNIPSPMGAYLSAFTSLEAATKVQNEKGGLLFDWESLDDYLIKD